MGKNRNACMREFYWENLKDRDNFVYPSLDKMIIFKWTLSNWLGELGLDLCGSGKGHVADCSTNSYEPSDSIKCGDIFE
jgi:hypothetical protein